ncbi:hypothetical protein [Flavobacterium sp.]|uniref:hypothetical protein n=1 Tax=Flavobacterium sp. TaxID=239 RepID=UPI003D6B1B6C
MARRPIGGFAIRAHSNYTTNLITFNVLPIKNKTTTFYGCSLLLFFVGTDYTRGFSRTDEVNQPLLCIR